MTVRRVRLVAIEEQEYVAYFQLEEELDVNDPLKDIEVGICEYNDLWDLILQDYYQGLDVVYFLDMEQRIVTDTHVIPF